MAELVDGKCSAEPALVEQTATLPPDPPYIVWLTTTMTALFAGTWALATCWARD